MEMTVKCFQSSPATGNPVDFRRTHIAMSTNFIFVGEGCSPMHVPVIDRQVTPQFVRRFRMPSHMGRFAMHENKVARDSSRVLV